MKKIILGLVLMMNIANAADFTVQFSAEDNSISTAKIQDGAITASKIANEIIDDSKISSITSSKISNFGSSVESIVASSINNNDVSARYTQNMSQSIPNNSSTVVNFNIKDWDSHDAVSVGSSWKFTAPKSGEYEINGQVMFGGATWGAGLFTVSSLRKNGNVYIYTPDIRTYSVAFQFLAPYPLNAKVKLLQGEYVDFLVYHNFGVSLGLYGNSANNFIQIRRIGNY